MSYFYYDGPNSPMNAHVHTLFQVPLFEFPCFVDNQQEKIKLDALPNGNYILRLKENFDYKKMMFNLNR